MDRIFLNTKLEEKKTECKLFPNCQYVSCNKAKTQKTDYNRLWKNYWSCTPHLLNVIITLLLCCYHYQFPRFSECCQRIPIVVLTIQIHQGSFEFRVQSNSDFQFGATLQMKGRSLSQEKSFQGWRISSPAFLRHKQAQSWLLSWLFG